MPLIESLMIFCRCSGVTAGLVPVGAVTVAIVTNCRCTAAVIGV
jgi:hypothetical protein